MVIEPIRTAGQRPDQPQSVLSHKGRFVAFLFAALLMFEAKRFDKANAGARLGKDSESVVKSASATLAPIITGGVDRVDTKQPRRVSLPASRDLCSDRPRQNENRTPI